MPYKWDFSAVLQYWDLFAWGLWLTFAYTVGSIIIGVVLGLILCFGRLSRFRVISGLARAYQEVFRCTPLLVQLMWFYYALPLLIGITIENYVAAMLTLSLYAGSF